MLRGLEKRKFNLTAKLEKVEHAIKSRTDDVADFRQMGIDHLFVRNMKCLSYRTLDGDYGVPYISDHYPIEIVVRLK